MSSDPFLTLADPMRRRIVEILRDGERAVSDVVDAVDIEQSGVSRHLRILQEAGFVTVRPEGQKRMYSLRPEPFREIDAWLARYRAMWEVRLDALGEALRRKKAQRAQQEKQKADDDTSRRDEKRGQRSKR